MSQIDMFTGAVVDNRTRAQKEAAKKLAAAEQLTLFKGRDILQFGVNPRPQLSLPSHAPLRLMKYDPRTPEEVETDTQKQAEKLTPPLWSIRLKVVNMPPHEYAHQLRTVLALPAPQPVLLLGSGT